MTPRPPLVVPLLVAAGCALIVTRQPVSDSDLFWHLANGRDLVSGAPAGVEHFSWTVAGLPVVLDQWLGDILLYVAYDLGGWRALIALRALAVACIAATVMATALSAVPRRPFLALLAVLPALVVSRYGWTDRPELFGVVCFAILIPLLRRDDDRAAWLLPPLVLAWSCLHGSYVLGLVLILLVLAERSLRATERRRSLIVGAATIAAALPAALLSRLAPTSQFWQPPREISEWGVPDVTTMPAFLVGLVLVACLAGALVRRATSRELVILIAVAFVSLTAMRHLPFFPVAAAPYLASLLGALGERRGLAPVPALAVGRAAHALSAAAALVVFAAGVATSPAEPDLSGFPVAALSRLPSGPGVLANYDWGGFLIWYAPSTPVFIDGRLNPYRPDVLADYRAIVGAHPDWEEVADRRGVRAILSRPGDAIAVRAPDLGWRIAYSDASVVMLLR